MIYIHQYATKRFDAIDTTSRSKNWSRGLSPFMLDAVPLYGRYQANCVENAWQFAKVYPEHVDENGEPTEKYFDWAEHGWAMTTAVRYPMGRGAKPLYSLWDGQKLSYIEARKKIYCPLYSHYVEKTDAYKWLKSEHEKGSDLHLKDFDGYDHRKLGMTYQEVLNCENRKMGHAFVLGMMLEDQRVWEEEGD